MLTATYSLVAISAEQKTARTILSGLQRQIQGILRDLHSVNRSCIESALHKLEQFEDFCHRRKVEAYVIPTVRKLTHEADALIAELESLSTSAVSILRSLKEQLRVACQQGVAELNKLCSAMEMYCANLMKRFAKEEEELLPLVQGTLPGEAWFDIAAKFLSDEANKKTQARLLLQQ